MKIIHGNSKRRFLVESTETIEEFGTTRVLLKLSHIFRRILRRFEKQTRRGHRVQHICTHTCTHTYKHIYIKKRFTCMIRETIVHRSILSNSPCTGDAIVVVPDFNVDRRHVRGMVLQSKELAASASAHVVLDGLSRHRREIAQEVTTSSPSFPCFLSTHT